MGWDGMGDIPLVLRETGILFVLSRKWDMAGVKVQSIPYKTFTQVNHREYQPLSDILVTNNNAQHMYIYV